MDDHGWSVVYAEIHSADRVFPRTGRRKKYTDVLMVTLYLWAVVHDERRHDLNAKCCESLGYYQSPRWGCTCAATYQPQPQPQQRQPNLSRTQRVPRAPLGRTEIPGKSRIRG